MDATASNNTIGWFKAISTHSISRQILFLAGLAGSIALGVSVVLWSQGDEYVPLYGSLSAEDSSEIVRSLETKRVKYQLDRMSGNVEVPADKVHEVRIQLAAEGLPSGEGKGFDMLYREQEMGLSSFMEKARYDRALEEELSRTVAAIESVKAARVHLAIPKPSGFIRATGRPAASVFVNLYPGRELSESQLAGIMNMVASSVPELSVEGVSVVDQGGRLLSFKDSEDGVVAGLEQFNITQKLEQSYVNRILEILTPMTGRDGVRAQVKADLDFTMVETTSEVYAPEASVRSEQLVEEKSATRTNGGIPGTLANEPPDDATLELEPVNNQENPAANSSTRSVRNYELDKTISHTRQAPGSLKRLSVAVVLDYQEAMNEEGEMVRTPATEEALARIESLVREAVGFDEARGDRVTVTSASFLAPAAFEPLPEPSFMDNPMIWKVARILVAAIVCFILIFKVIKPVLRSASESATKSASTVTHQQTANPLPALNPGVAHMPGGLPGAPGVQQMGNETVSLSGQMAPPIPSAVPGAGPVYRQQLDAARSMVSNEPDRVAHVVKNWVASDA